MLFAEKMDLFNFQKLNETKLIEDEASLRSVGVYSRFSSLNGIMFEDGVSFQAAAAGFVSNIFFGAYSYMNSDGYIRSNTAIGRFCSIGRRVSINAGMHSITGLSSHPMLNNNLGRGYSDSELNQLGIVGGRNKNGFVKIGHDVWIGDGVVILPGVIVGNGAVLAANSVVSSDVEPYSIVGGIPNKQIRKRFSDDVITRLLATEYWEFSVDYIKSLPLANVISFLEEFERNSISAYKLNYETFKVG
jgi:virginiamycin A acetyltransferase